MKSQIIGVLMCMLLLIPGSIAVAFSVQKTLSYEDTKPPAVWFTLPKKSIFYPLFRPILVASTQIWAHASDDESDVNYCEWYIDDELKASFPAFPRSWTWNEPSNTICSIHFIKAVAYDNAGNIGCDEIIVWKFF